MAIDWTSLLNTGLNLAGTNYASNQAISNNQALADQTAAMSQFRPVGVTTRFGSSGFNFDPTTGQLVSAGYQVAPDVAAMREGMMGMAGTSMNQAQAAQAMQPQYAQAAQGLFNLGQGYLAETPQQAAQTWMGQQQQLLAPGREQELARLTNTQQQQGRMGLGVGATQAGYTQGGQGLAATNPQMAAYYNAKAQQDAQLASQAQQAGQAQTTYGYGLLGNSLDLLNKQYTNQTNALAPYQQYLTNAQTAENLGQGAFTLGTGLGSNAAASAQQAAKLYGTYGSDATALQNQTTTALIKGLTDPISQLIKGLSA